jgi:clathrin heavy chain
VAPENIKFGFSTLESDKYITICETAQQQIAIVDLTTGNTVSRLKMSAEAAIMNPLSKVVALRGKKNYRLFSLIS